MFRDYQIKIQGRRGSFLPTSTIFSVNQGKSEIRCRSVNKFLMGVRIGLTMERAAQREVWHSGRTMPDLQAHQRQALVSASGVPFIFVAINGIGIGSPGVNGVARLLG